MYRSALEANQPHTRVDLTIDPENAVIQEAFARYFGLTEGVTIFLAEISHPLRNWGFIVQEARRYALDYFHLLKSHPTGDGAALRFVGIFCQAIRGGRTPEVHADAVDNLLLFLQTIISDSGPDLPRFLPVLNQAFRQIQDFDDERFFLFVRSFYQIKKIVAALAKACPECDARLGTANRLLSRYLDATYRYWLGEADPASWLRAELSATRAFHQTADYLENISHAAITGYARRLGRLTAESDLSTGRATAQLLELPGFDAFIERYRHVPGLLHQAGSANGKGNYWKVIFLFHIMNISGLSRIHEDTLRDINRTMGWLIENESSLNTTRLMDKTFSILRTRIREFPTTAFNCLLNMGRGVYKTDDIELINFFIDSIIDLGFQFPMVEGVGNDWQIKANTAHLQNIRTWMKLIERNPKRSVRLMSHLTIHLSLCGVFIRDTDLFPRDISRLLNSNLGPAYNPAKQLVRLFPSYFNDIGAEGKLRDISTQLDELTLRRDVLVHFLRKQSHVESNNRIIGFMEAVLEFWATRNKQVLRPFIPPNIYDRVQEQGEFIEGVHRILALLDSRGVNLPRGLLTIGEDEMERRVHNLDGIPEVDRRRVLLITAFYKLLNQKYHLDFTELTALLDRLRVEAFPHLDELKAALDEPDLRSRIRRLLDYLERLKDILLSEETFEPREDIYKKRHFTVDIPSMYGSYHEKKFDALGLGLRIESLVNVLFEDLVADINLDLITKATFYQIYDRLQLFVKALRLEGISSLGLERQMDLLEYSLEVKGFTFSQYVDIFKGFVQCVKNIIDNYFNNIHGQNLTRALDRMPVDQILPKFLPAEGLDDTEKLRHRVSEIFFRDRIALSLGLQQLDLFLSRILNTLYHQANKLPKDKLHQLLLYDPQRVVTPVDHVAKIVSGLIDLGNKGYHLAKMSGLGLPVPAGFIITTEAFRWRVLINSYLPAQQNFTEQIRKEVKELEKKTGKRLGDLSRPLLVSVRSGSTISQPGMMDTFLDVGINDEITESMAGLFGNAWFAWDSYRRFLQCWGMAFGLERNDFDAVMGAHKKKWGLIYKRQFTGEHMKIVALAYKEMIQDAGIDLIQDPFEQLSVVIKLVFASWDSSKARTYRKIIGISDDWGTAVVVQSMVFGNISQKSGSGVICTHNPRWSGDTLRLWGDFSLGNQGEDVVSGLVSTLPISIFQQEIEMRETDTTLETHFPHIYGALKGWSTDLVEKMGWPPQEIEFTFEGPNPEDLYLLQARDMSTRGGRKELAFDPEDAAEEKLLGTGIGASGGAMSGRLVFSLEDIRQWRRKEPNMPLILARGDTVPDDIREIFSADGLLTAKGGVTSHAAVVAHRLEKTCVVGCGNLACDEINKRCTFNRISLSAGEIISIDGQRGSIYAGTIRVKQHYPGRHDAIGGRQRPGIQAR